MSRENTQYPHEPEFSIKKLVDDRFSDVKYILRFKTALALVLLVGALLGALTAWLWTPSYTARLTFVVDDSKSSGSGGLSALAGLAGVDLNGLGGGSGVLAGDNVQELIKSRKLIKATLVTAYDSTQTLADRYAAVNKLSKKWLKYSPDGKIIRFPLNGLNNSRLQDSLLHEMSELILKGEFEIAKTDKKLGFFEVNTTMDDEKLSQLFCMRMINQATNFYISTKTKRLRDNIDRLQKRADSIGLILNRKTYAAAAANQGSLDVNPAYTAPSANVEVRERDKILLSTVFSETVKNLETSKTMLAQETPTVQIVDEPELPLKKNKLKYSIGIATGIFLSGLFFSFYVLFKRKDSKI
ncbi:hypothetical protein [Mucilaginibacter sp. UR6-11]|uniref:hypothetical protein n=1 Tax=Mucilaginibacter sp. UR6-11 TaxID=1435644 RepID=UPI001E3E8161|nr:hypothetical protein [Mucilaginibacter sp. UR6-11]MCC8423964.1 hypothetical protein [Mucilaginibacter sp. UR6-11]